jgi:hypothetical protein
VGEAGRAGEALASEAAATSAKMQARRRMRVDPVPPGRGHSFSRYANAA